MPVTTYDMANINGIFGWGSDMGSYLNRAYFYAPYGYGGTFPPNNIGINIFMSTSPINEWNCDCANCSMK